MFNFKNRKKKIELKIVCILHDGNNKNKNLLEFPVIEFCSFTSIITQFYV